MQLKINKNADFGFISVFLDSNNLNECLTQMQKEGLKNIIINSEHGWKIGESLEFINNNTWITGVQILCVNCDITPLNSLQNLEYLSINENQVTGNIDLSNFPNLKYMSIWWNNKIFKNISSCIKCEFLYISKWPFKSLDQLKNFVKLKTLQINYSKIQSLDGVENLINLKSLDLYSMPALESLNALKKITSSLELFSIDKCKKIGDYKVLEDLINIKFFYIMDSAPLPSVNFINSMPKIEYVYIGVEILDKDISILNEKGFKFKRSKYYK